MAVEARIRELMVGHFPTCPLCGSDAGYDVTSAIKGHVRCKSCSTEWSSLDFITGATLDKMKVRELPKGASSYVVGGHRLRRGDEYPVSFWGSLAESEEQLVQTVKLPMEYLLLSLILLVAAYLRVANLGGLYIYDYDEGVYCESARMIVKGNLPHAQVFSSQPPHFILLVAAFLKLFGMDILFARLFIVFTSMIAIVSVHLIAKSIEDYKAGLASALFLSISPYFVRMSRSVQAEVPSISFALLGFWLFFGGFRSKSDVRLFLSGVVVCLGAMMKLNVGMVAAFLFVLLVARKELRGLAFFMVGVIVPLLILPFFNLNKVIDQMILFHFTKPDTGTWQDRGASIYSMLMMDSGLTVTASIGAVLCATKKALEGRFVVALTGATFAFLLYYKAFFMHQAVILVPLLAILGGVALVNPLNRGSRLLSEKASLSSETNQKSGRKQPLVARRRRLVASALVVASLVESLFYGVTAVGVLSYDSRLTSPRDDPRYIQAVSAIRAYASSVEYIISDEQILAFFAERDVPPDLADTSHMRISSGYLNSETVIAFTKEYNVKLVILWTGRLKRLTKFVDYVKANYQIVETYDGREIYLRVR